MRDVVEGYFSQEPSSDRNEKLIIDIIEDEKLKKEYIAYKNICGLISLMQRNSDTDE